MNMRPPVSALLISTLAGAVGGGIGIGLGLLVALSTFWFIVYAAILLGAAVSGFVATWLTIALRWTLRSHMPAWPKGSFILWAIASLPLATCALVLSPVVHDNIMIDGACVAVGCGLVGLLEALLIWPRAIQERLSARDFLGRYRR